MITYLIKANQEGRMEMFEFLIEHKPQDDYNLGKHTFPK